MKRYLLPAVLFSLFTPDADAADDLQSSQNQKEEIPSAKSAKESPWLITPTFSSNPKLGNSIGGLAAYLHKFDDKSPSSIFGVTGNYSDTHSSTYGFFSRAHFSADQHRMKAAIIKGKIENEYEDFLGTGLQANTTDNLTITYLNYTKRLQNDWFIGLQMLGMKHEILADDLQTQAILDAKGIDSLNSRGLGGVIEYDSRDSQHSPQDGSLFTFHNVAFRDAFGSDEDYDTYNVKYSQYFGHGDGNVFAMQFEGRWTSDAPTTAYSSVTLRGYTRGEYLAPNSVTFQIEERYAFNDKWGATAFIGAACLYGDGASCGDNDNWFPAIGAGATYMVKMAERMVVRAEFAVGRDNNQGFYIQFGNSF